LSKGCAISPGSRDRGSRFLLLSLLPWLMCWCGRQRAPAVGVDRGMAAAEPAADGEGSPRPHRFGREIPIIPSIQRRRTVA
jgi:hypothetical protein